MVVRLHSPQVVDERLQIIAGKTNLVLHHNVMSWSCGTNQTSLRLQVKVKSVGVYYTTIHNGTRWQIFTAVIDVSLVSGVEPDMMTLATDDESDLWIVTTFELQE